MQRDLPCLIPIGWKNGIESTGLYAPDMVLRCRRRKRRRMQAVDPGRTDFFQEHSSGIEISDYVVANVNCFRGGEPDSGTCFEIGYAHALGKKIYGDPDDTRTMMEKIGGETGRATAS